MGRYYALVIGLASLLHIPSYFGRVTIFDLLIPFLFILVINRKLSKTETGYIGIVIFLLLLQVMIDLSGNTLGYKTIIKEVVISSGFMSAPIVLKRVVVSKRDESYLAFGFGTSFLISLFMMHNGVYLDEVGVSSNYFGISNLIPLLPAKMVVPAICFFVFGTASVLKREKITIITMVIVAVYSIMNGARSDFIIWFSAVFIYVNRKRNSKAISLILILVLGLSLYFLYSYLALSGIMGSYEKEKYISQIVESDSGVFGGRESSLETAIFCITHPWVMAGSDYTWYTQRLSGHTIIFGYWLRYGIFWAIFLFYFLLKSYSLVRENISLVQSVYLLVFIWHLFFSPFGIYKLPIFYIISRILNRNAYINSPS